MLAAGLRARLNEKEVTFFLCICINLPSHSSISANYISENRNYTFILNSGPLFRAETERIEERSSLKAFIFFCNGDFWGRNLEKLTPLSNWKFLQDSEKILVSGRCRNILGIGFSFCKFQPSHPRLTLSPKEVFALLCGSHWFEYSFSLVLWFWNFETTLRYMVLFFFTDGTGRLGKKIWCRVGWKSSLERPQTEI